jgi:alpha-tubulin suppressor-like RCC1 family protein
MPVYIFPLLTCRLTDVLTWISFPANSNFELGRGSNCSDWRPQVVPSLKNIRVMQVACGGYHSLALTGKF